jgi:hypothetical protein
VKYRLLLFNGRFGVILLALLYLAPLEVRAAVHYVVPPGTGGAAPEDPYTNWATAGTNIIEVVNAAMTNAAPRVVWVTNGEYYLTNQIVMTNIITVRSFSGHYSNTIINGGWPTYTNRCFYVVNTGVLDGFTIRNGYYGGSNDFAGGGGAMLSNATIQNCCFAQNIYSNAGSGGGGGAYVAGGGIISNCYFFSNWSYKCSSLSLGGGALVLRNGRVIGCTLISNFAPIIYSGGGGIYMANTADVVSNCLIAYNSANYAGGVKMDYGLVTDCVISNNIGVNFGGVLVNGASVIVRNSSIINNSSTWGGGGVYLQIGGLVSNCVIAGNRSTGAGSSGGGILISRSSGNNVVEACRISNNICTASPGGGGISITNGGVVRNSLIHHNTNSSASGNGGGALLGNASASSPYGLINCTIANNYSANEGGGIAALGPSNNIVNCIIAANRSAAGVYPDVYNYGSNSNNYWYSCANAAFSPNQGNITNAPDFMDTNGNWRLQPSSPCINTGTNQSWMTNAYDLDGHRRIIYGTVDMGCYEAIYEGTIYLVGF